MSMSVSNSSNQSQIDRRQQMEAPKKVESSSTTAAEQAKATAPAAPAEEAQVRTHADAATVDASRQRAAGAEDVAKQRALNPNASNPTQAATPARGLKQQEGPKSCLIQEADKNVNPADLLEQIRGKGSGKGISDDGSECAPIARPADEQIMV